MREIGHHDGEALTLNALGDTLHQAGDLTRAREVYETGLRLSEERGLRVRQEIFRLSLGHLLIDLGQHAAARVLLERAVGDAQRSGQFHVEMYGQLRLARLDREEGHPTSSLGRVREVFQRARSRGFEGMALEALVLHAELHAEHGDAAYAQQLRVWLAQAPALPESQRERLRGRLAAAHAAVPATAPPAGFDITVAAQRLAAPLPSAGESPITNGSSSPPAPAVPTTARRRAAQASSERQR